MAFYKVWILYVGVISYIWIKNRFAVSIKPVNQNDARNESQRRSIWDCSAQCTVGTIGFGPISKLVYLVSLTSFVDEQTQS